MRRQPKGPLVAGLVIVGWFAVVGCTDTVDSNDWNLEEGETEEIEYPILQGEYQIEWEILEDTCEPPLDELMSEWEEWPPPRMGVKVSSADTGSEGLPSMWMNHYLLRHFGTGGGESTFLNLDYTPKEKKLFDFVFPREQDLKECPPPGLEAGANFQNEVVGKATGEGEITVEVHTTWQDYEDCDESEYELRTDWIPREVCTEAYRMTLRLDKPCEPVEECTTHTNHSSRSPTNDEGLPPYEVREVPCFCD